jgi:hypothetical protein
MLDVLVAEIVLQRPSTCAAVPRRYVLRELKRGPLSPSDPLRYTSREAVHGPIDRGVHRPTGGHEKGLQLHYRRRDLLGSRLSLGARPANDCQGWPRHPVQRTYRRRWSDRLRPCLQDGDRRHRVETKGLGLPFRALARLAQNEESECTGRDTGGRRGLELEHGRTGALSPRLVPQLQ